MVVLKIDPSTSIPAFYAGRSIFITGSTGFMGKVLIEKLLRSCPDVAEIFLLMRPKKGLCIDDRLRKMISLPLYDVIRETNPSAFNKLIPVTGDVSMEGLGLPPMERMVVIEKTSVIFHVAANVRFDDMLKDAVLLNVRGTREVCILAGFMKKLVVLMHVSTTYCNTNRPVVEEKIYPALADWKKTIKIAETLDSHSINVLTAKYLGNMPNTYTFTKQLGEQVVNEYSGKLPSVVVRPSIVISTLKEPIKGWIDNFNGPVGLLVGGGKGILRTVYADPNIFSDFIPVDLTIKLLIVAAWDRGIKTITQDPSITVYNSASNNMRRITTRDLISLGFRTNAEVPLENCLWSPNTFITTNKTWHYISSVFMHLLPALLIDGILRLSGMKPMLLKVQRKVYSANVALTYFLFNVWDFRNDNSMKLLNKIPEKDLDAFSVNFLDFDISTYFKHALIGCKLYLLKESMEKLDACRRHNKRMWWIDMIVKIWFAAAVIWFTLHSFLPSYLSNGVLPISDNPTPI